MMRVFWKIREMSACSSANPRPMIMIEELASQLKTSVAQLTPAIKELKRQRLIQIVKPGNNYVKLTMLGLSAA
ncbi:MAG: hypothetical protein R2800_04035 [Flavipsychrobacter sp.]